MNTTPPDAPPAPANHQRFGAVLFVKDVARVAAFYASVAGLVTTESEATWARLGNGAFELVVHGIPAEIAATISISQPPVRREDTPIKLVLPVPSIALAREAAERLGGALNPPDREWQLGDLRVCDGHDPEGNVFQLRAAAD